jgi:cold shock CspA family protein
MNKMEESGSGSIYTGCVKWFNSNMNYGFITVLSEGKYKDADIFVHQSNIKTTGNRNYFRTLYTGECVQFEITKSNNEKHPIHAVNVSGFNGIQLHCENPIYKPQFNNHLNNHAERNNEKNTNFRGRSYRGRFKNVVSRNNFFSNKTRETTTQTSKPQEPATVTQEPSAVTQEPSAVTQDPSAVTQEPATVTQEPATVTQEPATVTQEPAAVTQEPATVTQEPATREPETSKTRKTKGQQASKLNAKKP